MRRNVALNEIENGLNLKEKIIAKVFTKFALKIYKKGIEKGVNSVL